MYPLDKVFYPLALKAVATVPFNTLFVQVVLEGDVDGVVLTDCPKQPKAFYLIPPYAMSLLFGEIRSSFIQQQLKPYLLNQQGEQKQAEWLQVHPVTVEQELDSALDSELAIATEQLAIRDRHGNQ